MSPNLQYIRHGKWTPNLQYIMHGKLERRRSWGCHWAILDLCVAVIDIMAIAGLLRIDSGIRLLDLRCRNQLNTVWDTEHVCLAFCALWIFVLPSLGNDKSGVPNSFPLRLIINFISHQGRCCRGANCRLHCLRFLTSPLCAHTFHPP